MFTPLKNIIGPSVARHKIKKQVDASVVCEAWETIKAGGKIRCAADSRALYMRDQKLFVEVSHHAIAQELLYQKQTIITLIKKIAPGAEVIDIKFVA